jgi:hypothetical protein
MPLAYDLLKKKHKSAVEFKDMESFLESPVPSLFCFNYSMWHLSPERRHPDRRPAGI